MAGVNVKMGVTGISQFKQSMSQAQQSVKTLDAELKLNEKQFKASGDAETYMQKKTQLLQNQISQQKTVIASAEKALKAMQQQGIDPASKAFQAMQQQVYKAQTELLNMQDELKNVNRTMSETTEAAKDTGTAIESIGKKVNFDAVINGLGKITDGMEAGARKARDLAAELMSSMTSAASWADDLLTMAMQNGIDQETLQRMQQVADFIDTPVDAIIAARQKLANNMKYGSNDVMNAFEELNIMIGGTVGKGGEISGYRALEDVFWDIGEAIMAMGEGADKEAMSTKLLGRGWKELMPLFQAGREAYEEMLATRNVVSDEDVENLGKLDDTIQSIRNEFETLQTTVLAQLAPGFTEIGNTISDLLSEFNKYLQSDEGRQKLNDLNEAVTNLFSSLGNVDFGAAMDKAKEALDALTDGLDWIKNNWGAVETGLKALGVAFGAMKVTESVLTFMQLLASGKFLFGGGGGGAQKTATQTVTETVASESLLQKVLGSDAARYLSGAAAFMTTLFADPLFKEKTNGMSWFDSDEEKKAYYKENPEIQAEAGLQFMTIWSEKFADAMKNALDPSKWFGSGWGITEDVNLDDVPFLNVSPAQWEAMEKYWDTIREFGPYGPQESQAYQELLDRFVMDSNDPQGWTDMAAAIAAIYGLNGSAYSGEDLPDWWSRILPQDEPVEFPAEPELTPDSQELLQSGLDLLTLKLPVTPYLTDDSMLPFYPHANGLYSVPFDGYPALLHKGERVMTARESEAASRNFSSNLYVESMYMNSGTDAEGLAAAMAAAQRRTMNGFGS